MRGGWLLLTPFFLSRHLYVSTIDGGLTALSEHGHILWTYNARNALFHSTLSKTEVSSEVWIG